jgi:mono/diheme cytochrome c family protein
MRITAKRGVVAVSLLTAALMGCQSGRKQTRSTTPTTPPVSVAPTTAEATPAVLLSSSQPSSTQPGAVGDPSLARGMQLYVKQCAACHGAQGLGDGSAAYLLYPKPRDFSQGVFRLTSTKSGLPTDDDLLQTLRRGMPGSAMPAWGWMPESDLRALVAAVKQLALEAKITRVRETNKSMSPEKASKLANTLLASGPVVAFPPKPAEGRVSLDRGKELYATNCAACHDADGRGRNKRDLKDQSDFPVFARDFTKGVFKGGSSENDIARRLLVGMPGSPMPAAAAMPSEDFWSLVAYVRSFVPPGVQERVEQTQKTLTAKRIDGSIEHDVPAAVWERTQAVFLPVTPLFWRDDRIEGLNVRAIHDGSRVAVQLNWNDATGDERPVKPQQFTDAVAIQLAPASDPPFFAMGQKDAQVNIWHWKASWQHDLSGANSLAEVYPDHAPLSQIAAAPQFPDFQTARDVGNPVAQPKHASSIECLTAAGFGTLTNLGPSGQSVVGTARRTATGWEVVFVHPLEPAHAGELPLVPGQTLSIGFAVWDGASGDRNGQKSVTIWHRIAIDK